MELNGNGPKARIGLRMLFGVWMNAGATMHFCVRLLGGVRGAAIGSYCNYILCLA